MPALELADEGEDIVALIAIEISTGLSFDDGTKRFAKKAYWLEERCGRVVDGIIQFWCGVGQLHTAPEMNNFDGNTQG